MVDADLDRKERASVANSATLSFGTPSLRARAIEEDRRRRELVRRLPRSVLEISFEPHSPA